MNKMRARAQTQFPTVLLTLISIIQALALELMWSKIAESDFLWTLDINAIIAWGMLSVTLVLRGKSICVTGEVFEMPALAERSLSLVISGTEVCSESAKHKAGGPRMHRGPFASVWIVALVGDGPRVLLQAASR